MGIGVRGYVPSGETRYVDREVIKIVEKSINPDPSNYKVIQVKTLPGGLLVVKINYPDCTNYEGDKILVFENVNLEDFINTKEIDPHFSNSIEGVHPIARFKPDDRGMIMAIRFCEMWYHNNKPNVR